MIEDGKESHSTTIRNVGLVVGGVIALVIAVWRGLVANREAHTAEADLGNTRYREGAKLLGSGVLAVRLAGIYALRRLAEDHPEEYHTQVMRLLAAFVRHPTTDPNDTGISGQRAAPAGSLGERARHDRGGGLVASERMLSSQSESRLSAARNTSARISLAGSIFKGPISGGRCWPL